MQILNNASDNKILKYKNANNKNCKYIKPKKIKIPSKYHITNRATVIRIPKKDKV